MPRVVSRSASAEGDNHGRRNRGGGGGRVAMTTQLFGLGWPAMLSGHPTCGCILTFVLTPRVFLTVK